MIPAAEWTRTGERVPALGHHVFTRVSGAGPWLTLLHGFPTSSWDWAAVAPALEAQHRLLAFDFLGYGESDKPAAHDYRLMEQADITEALWERFGITETGVVAHDYGVSVAQELLARAREGRLGVALTGVVFLNGGLFPHLHRARLVQKLLLVPGLGTVLGRAIGYRAFSRSLTAVFARKPADDELRQHWDLTSRRGGRRIYHRLIRYIPERRAHAARWSKALDDSTVPLRFVWGMDDPVSGAHVAAHLRERLPKAPRVELAGVGHYPQLEAPDAVAREILDAFASREVAAPAPIPEPSLTEEERRAFDHGVDEFNRGLFFECHDTLEDLWSGLRGPSRDFFQGLIQVSVAHYHAGNGNPAGALSMLDRAERRFTRYPDRYFGFDLGGERRAIAAWREEIQAGRAPSRPAWRFGKI